MGSEVSPDPSEAPVLKKGLGMMETSQQNQNSRWGRRCQQRDLSHWEVTQEYWYHCGSPAPSDMPN